jgi:[acyl-carrier-protein] S-malonyltransferase
MTGLGVLCPGQGDQHPSMLDLALCRDEGKEVLKRAAAVLGQDPLAVLRRGAPGVYENAVAQPLVCAAELATWAALRESLPRPTLFAGYSLGELAAYGCAGALSPGGTVAMAARRAGAMESANASAGGLVALRGLALPRVEALAGELGAEVAIVNGPDHFVVGGSAASLAALERRALDAGATSVRRLSIGVPAHTRLLAAAVEPFAAALRGSGLSDPEVPVLAGVSGQPVRRREEVVPTLSRQLAERIEWARCLATASEMGCSVFLEIGPGNALSRMAREILPGALARSVDEFRSREGVLRWVEASLARR